MSETPDPPAGAGGDPLTQIFHAARELPEQERVAFVERACADDRALRDELLRLLEASGDANARNDGHTEAVRGAIEAVAASGGLIGRRVGDFELTAVLGQGGMGTVYLGERVAGGFEQTAAVKLLPMGLDSPPARWRFEQERRHLAALSHPSIAQIYGGGVTEDGTPYLIMEYVDGVQLTDFCDSKALSVRERLQLFLSVCAAVQHAHEHLLVHRDLKPSNILVTEEGLPKLLDFGIARALDPNERASPGEMTRLGPVFTPAYSSPEQIWGDELTTATDVFSLGVVLYELLSGDRPYGSETTRDHEDAMRRFVKLPTIDEASARRRAASVPELRRALKRDLSRIVSTAIRDEPEARYQTVVALATDIQRFLERRPVRAAPPTLRYKLERLVARRPTELALGALIVLFIGYSLGQTVQARLDGRRARAFNEFMAGTVLSLESFDRPSPSVTLGEALDSALLALSERPLRSRAAHLDALGAIGGAYLRIGRPRDGLPLLQQAVGGGREDPPYGSLARLHQQLAGAHLQVGRADSATVHLLHALDGYPAPPDTSVGRERVLDLLDSIGVPGRPRD